MNSTTSYSFTTSDPFGNTVSLSEGTWTHITIHKEMVQYKRAVQLTVENPSVIYISTDDENSLVFHGERLILPSPNIIRVVIEYENMVDIRSGGTEGIVLTSYPVSPVTQYSGRIGSLFYERPKKSKPGKK